ncbi:MAG: hypothetical protein HUN05_20740 [Desulfobacter sp.]|nr:MAG: hypothetical protein HUN05_20740 [Desulfobacter sp.]
MENLQQLNTQTGDSNRFVIPFPMLAGEQLDFGQLFINTGKKKNETQAGENRVIQIAFLMNMTALGRIRADFSILKKEITGRFMLEDQECCDYMNGLIPELKHQLISLAYRPGKIECQVAKPRALSADALIQSMIKPDESRGLDLVI